MKTISPLDGRYYNKLKDVADIVSEENLMLKRVLVEIKYVEKFLPVISDKKYNNPNKILTTIIEYFENNLEEEYLAIKKIENITNHDVKAVEYYIKNKFDERGIGELKEYVHIGLTSADINSVAYNLIFKDIIEVIFKPEITKLIARLIELSQSNDIVMLARTHGQAASPTTVGKELRVFIERLEIIMNQPFLYCAKFGGSVGNFNALKVAYPDVNWKIFADEFIAEFKLKRQQTTTQIEHYDNLAEMFDRIKRSNIVMLDLCVDIWYYISMNYFKIKPNEREIGSSTMPHKVNPIDFENAEGNLYIANALFEVFSNKLPMSRLQRDLSDSTILRNVGVAFGHCILAIRSINKGLQNITTNEAVVFSDLDSHWEVITEAIQTILRREGYTEPYEMMKKASRGKKLSKSDLYEIIENMDISQNLKTYLHKITPHNYYGFV